MVVLYVEEFFHQFYKQIWQLIKNYRFRIASYNSNGGHIFTQQFWDNFLCMSGAGIVIGLVIYITFLPNQSHYVA